MTDSPPKDGEPAADASAENSDNQMSRDPEGPAREPYDFDVKEQDRWLPIANGRFNKSPCAHLPNLDLQLYTKQEETVGTFCAVI